MSHKFQPSGMDMAGFRAEPPHVAQQSRREKLRVQPIPPAPDHLLVPYRSADVYDPALLDFSSVQEPSPFANPSAGFHDGAAAGIWKSLAGSQPAYDWITSCTGVGTATPIQASLYPSHVVQRGAGDLSSSQENHKPFGDLHFASPPFCPTPSAGLHESQGMEMASIVQQSIRDAPQPWADGGNELLLLPSYATQPANAPRLENTAVWLSRQQPQWTSEEAFVPSKAEDGFGAVPSDGSTKGLSLSLSSNPLPELHVAQFEERFGHEDFAARSDINDVGISGCYPKYGISGRGYGNSIQGSAGCSSSADVRRGAGPLGPFTGYATILKSSKFLKPAQQLMDEFCSAVTGSRLAKQYCDGSLRSSGAVTSAGDATVAENGVVGQREGNSGVSSCSLYSSTEAGGGEGSASDGASQVHRPEFQQKKAKLLYMQEEVCRRYKQYHQQMQMVVSSFESVAGLSAATPYTSLAVKAVSKHFRCLKSAISDQLRHISRVLGEEFMSSPGSSRGDAAATPRLKFIDQSLRRHKSSGDGSSAFAEHAQQQPVWRPQRGLPERSVAVLRAWLFEHFLHPYPTDTDKHMLASQTGLSRNQVSNWFINARVRLWKPMVEEIHMLETKGLTEMDLNSTNKNASKPGDPLNDGGQPSSDQRSDGQCSKPSDCSSMGSVPNDESYRASIERWHQEKRSRMDECLVPTGVDGGLMSFAAYQGGMDLGGLGAVSLTLGLRHNEGANVVHQQQQMRRHFGGQMLHDFVG